MVNRYIMYKNSVENIVEEIKNYKLYIKSEVERVKMLYLEYLRKDPKDGANNDRKILLGIKCLIKDLLSLRDKLHIMLHKSPYFDFNNKLIKIYGEEHDIIKKFSSETLTDILYFLELHKIEINRDDHIIYRDIIMNTTNKYNN